MKKPQGRAWRQRYPWAAVFPALLLLFAQPVFSQGGEVLVVERVDCDLQPCSGVMYRLVPVSAPDDGATTVQVLVDSVPPGAPTAGVQFTLRYPTRLGFACGPTDALVNALDACPITADFPVTLSAVNDKTPGSLQVVVLAGQAETLPLSLALVFQDGGTPPRLEEFEVTFVEVPRPDGESLSATVELAFP